MKRSKDILKGKDDKTLRAAGLTEDEIRELSDLRADYESQDATFKRAADLESELTDLRSRELSGTLTEAEQKKLDARLGVFYTVTVCGHQVKVNHCFIARAIIALFVLFATLNVIYIITVLKPSYSDPPLGL